MIKILILAITLATIAWSCRLQKDREIKAVQFFSAVPFRVANGKFVNNWDSVKIIEYEDYVLFQIPILEQPSWVQLDTMGNTILETPLPESITTRYFVYKKGDSLGLMYKGLHEKPFKEEYVDTFLKNTVFGNLPIYRINSEYRLVETVNLGAHRTLEKYVPIFKADKSYPDTNALYYDERLTCLNYALSKEMDSIKQSKLFRFEMLFNAYYDSASKLNIPQQNIVLELQPATIRNKSDIMNFIKKVTSRRNKNLHAFKNAEG